MVIWIIDDSDDHVRQMQEYIEAKLPGNRFQRFELPHDTIHAVEKPDVILIDISACGSLLDPSQCYSPILTLHFRNPNAVLLINSAVSAYFASEVVEDVLKEAPDANLRIVDWSDASPLKDIVAILEELI